MGKLPTPLRDYVLALLVKPEAKTASGIIVPTSKDEKTDEAVVKAVGKMVKDIKVNDVITYNSFSPIKKQVDGRDYILVKEEEVAAVD